MQGDLRFSRTGNDLVIKVADSQNAAANDQMTIKSWFNGNNYQIELLTFVDGTTLENTQIATIIGQQAAAVGG